MSHTRILSILAPRIHQFFNWTFDANALAEPLLKQEELPTYKLQILEKWGSLQQKIYQPPAYTPPVQPQPKLKG